MNILFVEAYPGFRGAQRSLAALLEGLGRRGAIGAEAPHRVAVLCLAPGRAEHGYRRLGVAVHSEPPPPALQVFGGQLLKDEGRRPARRLRQFFALMTYTRRLRRILRRARPHVVHCNQARGVVLVGPAARSLGIPVIWHQRGMLDLPPKVTRLTGRLAEHVVCVSEAVRRTLPPRLGPLATVIANGIDRPPSLPDKADLRRRLGIDAVLRQRHLPDDSLILVTASSLVPYKGLHHVVDALSRLAVEQPALSRSLLWILLGDTDGHAGKQAYRQRLQAAMADGGLTQHVWWAGWRDPAWPMVAAADLCLLPTVADELWTDDDGKTSRIVCSEGFPRTVLEAMSAGTAIIASDVAAVGEQLQDGISGRIVPPGHSPSLAQAIVELAGSADRRQALAAAAYRRVERFSVEAMTDQMLAFWSRRTTANSDDSSVSEPDFWRLNDLPPRHGVPGTPEES